MPVVLIGWRCRNPLAVALTPTLPPPTRRQLGDAALPAVQRALVDGRVQVRATWAVVCVMAACWALGVPCMDWVAVWWAPGLTYARWEPAAACHGLPHTASFRLLTPGLMATALTA